MQQLSSAQASPEVVLNENFQTLEHQAVYGKRHPATSGLVWGYYGGRWGGFSVADGAFTLAASATTYIVVKRADGAPSASTATTNWNNATDYARAYKITTGASAVTAVEDHRAGPGGAHGQAPGGGTGGSDRNVVTALSISSGVVAINAALGDYFTLALNANVTSMTFSNVPPACSLMVRSTQDSTPRTWAWPASFRWEGAPPAVSTAAGAVDVLALTTFDGGTKWDATLSKGRA